MRRVLISGTPSRNHPAISSGFGFQDSGFGVRVSRFEIQVSGFGISVSDRPGTTLSVDLETRRMRNVLISGTPFRNHPAC